MSILAFFNVVASKSKSLHIYFGTAKVTLFFESAIGEFGIILQKKRNGILARFIKTS